MAKKKRKTAPKSRSKSKPRSKWISVLFKLALLAFLGLSLLFTSVYFGFWGAIPSSSELKEIQHSEASSILSKEGKLIDKVYRVNRRLVEFPDLPEHLKQALIATEDERFYEHAGIDWRSLARVIIKSILLQDESAGGGSTISQQLAKNLFGRKDFGAISIVINKFKEIIIAKRLEGIYSKDEILALYFNTVSFSENTYGIGAGSERFFSKEVKDLNPEEAAVLIGLLKANTYYNPRLNPEPALERRNVVLAQMQRNDFITEEERDSLQALPLELKYRNLLTSGPAPYFSAQVQKELTSLLKDKVKADGSAWDPRSDGLIIKTTLIAKKQEDLQASYDKHLISWQKKFFDHWSSREPWSNQKRFFDQARQATPFYQALAAQGLSEEEIDRAWQKKRPMQLFNPGGDLSGNFSMNDSLSHYLKLLRGASVILDPKSGAVKAWIGGPNFRYLPFDAAAAPHSVASTFKPIVIAAALEAGFEPCEYKSAEQKSFPEYDNWTPGNYDDNYEGFYSMAGTLKKSVNTSTVAWFLTTGELKVRDLAVRMGLGPQIPKGPTLALGTLAASPLQMAVAYAAFANGGKKVSPYFIESVQTKDGEYLFKRSAPKAIEVISPETAQIVAELLQGVVYDGTAKSLSSIYGVRKPWAGKTGTSQNYSDAWFAAFSPQEVVLTWMGGVNPIIRFRSGSLGSGSTMALPVFARYAQKQSERIQWPELSEDLIAALDCPDYREENFWDRLRDVFDVDIEVEGDSTKNEEPEDESKGSWWERLFKKRS